MNKTRVLLVDDHEIVRLGLMTLINDHPDMEVVGEAGNAQDAVKMVEKLHPQVVLMDIRLPGESGIDATRVISARFPDSHVVMLTSFADESLVVQAIRAGAVGYVLKQVGNEELLRAITVAARGESVLDPSTTTRLLSRVREVERQADDEAFRFLSDRELEVLAVVAHGKTNAEIAEKLHLSEKTVRNYITSILAKLNLTNRVELATFAVQHRLSDRFKEH